MDECVWGRRLLAVGASALMVLITLAPSAGASPGGPLSVS
jgi:hypothetical protein